MMIAEKIKYLREQNKLTQTALAKKIGITRSGVNAWELGISVPSTQYIVELATLFGVSTDFLLDVNHNSAVNTEGLTEEDIKIIYNLIQHLKKKTRLRSVIVDNSQPRNWVHACFCTYCIQLRSGFCQLIFYTMIQSRQRGNTACFVYSAFCVCLIL